jgi:transcriptional regulator with XRE-family HTH domain
MGNNLKQVRKARGWTIERAADAMGMSRSGYNKLERGERRLREDHIQRGQVVFGVSAADLVADNTTVSVVGSVQRGGFILFVSSTEDSADAPRPPFSTETTVAVVGEGSVMPGVIEDGWLVYFSADESPFDEALLGALCCIGLEDGTAVVGRVYRGRDAFHFDVVTVAHERLPDRRVRWANKVEWIKPS